MPSQDQLNSLASELFILFARCEYALKSLGFIAPLGKKGGFRIDWPAFYQIYGHVIFENPNDALREAVEYLSQHPPKKQIINGSRQLDWVDDDRYQDAQWGVINRVTTVRNNLFHGGKFGGEWCDPERSYKLICAALTVLKEIASSFPIRDQLIV
ncbi:MAG TPA: hypothetical protein PKD17_17980 [Cellvibrionaceae bacterium]|nr:hypothetical protein [Cellvibrionaceae bacterium]